MFCASSKKMLPFILSFATLIIVLMVNSENKETKFKFHQTGYKIVHDRLEVESYNKQWISHTNVFCYWYNRTVRPINFTMTLTKDIQKLQLAVQLYKFLSNEYRYFPLGFEFNFCAALEQDSFGARDVMKCGNIYTNCTYKMGHTYSFCNWIVDSTKFPPHIPFGKYKLHLMLKVGSATIADYFWFGSAEEIFKWN